MPYKHLIAAIFTLGILVDLRTFYDEPDYGFSVRIREPGSLIPNFARSCLEPGPCYIEIQPGKSYVLYDEDGDSTTIWIPTE